MIVKCSSCDATYTVDDEKVKDKKFAFECPKCGSNVIIDNREDKKPADLDIPHSEETDDMIDQADTGHEIEEEPMADIPDMPAVEEETLLEEDRVEDTLPEEESSTDLTDMMDDMDTEFDLESPLDSDDLLEEEEDDEEDEVEPEIDMSLLGAPAIEEPEENSVEEEVLTLDDDPLAENNSDDDSSLDINLQLEEIGMEESSGLGELSTEKEALLDEVIDDILTTKEEEPEPVSSLEHENFEETLSDDLDLLDSAEDEIELGPFDEGKDEELETMEDESETLSLDDFETTESVDKEIEEMIDSPEDMEIDLESIEDEIEIDLQSEEIEPLAEEVPVEEEVTEEEPVDDESITLDLDSLDIDLEETESIQTGDEITDMEEPQELEISEKEDLAESETLDLDSLDISLEEGEEFKQSETLDDDDDEGRLSIGDAGLTLDELSAKSEEETIVDEDEEDLRLSIDEVAPDFNMDEVEESTESFITEEDEEETLLVDDFKKEDLPEVDFGDEDDLTIEVDNDFQEYDEDVQSYGEENRSGKGLLNFSIDYSLEYSRLYALLRFTGLYTLFLIPHLVVSLVYNILSSILAVVNWFLVLFTGSPEKDFAHIQEQNLRYSLSIVANGMDIVEETPEFAGRENIDYPLQLDVVPPRKYSRFLAFMRISCAGILLLALPHLVLLFILTLGVTVFYLVGLIMVMITGKWPTLIFDFFVRYLRYLANVKAYMGGLTDTYPSFRFD